MVNNAGLDKLTVNLGMDLTKNAFSTIPWIYFLRLKFITFPFFDYLFYLGKSASDMRIMLKKKISTKNI